jgi:uncharacterized iron-regulated protein
MYNNLIISTMKKKLLRMIPLLAMGLRRPSGLRSTLRMTMATLAVLGMLLINSSCEEDGGGNITPEENYEMMYQEILKAYVNTTVVPTYKALAEAAVDMKLANDKLKGNPTDQNVKEAAEAWLKARTEWELSEAFLFGPVGEQALDIDGHIDSWPLELNDILEVLNTGAQNLTPQQVWMMDAEVIGFHVTEYLLFRDGQPRPYSNITTAELNYLTAATDALVWDCILAYTAWVGTDKLPANMITLFNENQDVVQHLNDNPNYNNFADKLTTATNYNSWQDALSEIAAGAADIAAEVGTTKIEAPYREHKVEEVESWYSWHSLDDYTNNILSIKNAYLGGKSDNDRQQYSLSSYIKIVNPQLDTQIQNAIDDAIDKIKAMGTGNLSFYEVVRDQVNPTQVDDAVDACTLVADLFTQVMEQEIK